MAVHTCLQDSLISAINSPYLPTEEAHVCTWRNEATIAATGGAHDCPDPSFSRLFKPPWVNGTTFSHSSREVSSALISGYGAPTEGLTCPDSIHTMNLHLPQ